MPAIAAPLNIPSVSAPRRFPGPALVSFLLAIALYAITLRGGWVYDDTFAVQGDPRLHDVRLWPDYLRQGYVPDGVDKIWRPLTSLSFAVQWAVHGECGWAFHAVNILLHAVASALTAKLTGRLTGRPAGAAAYAAGLLFAAHPIHVEVVAGLVGRGESLAAVGIAGALFLFSRRPMSTGRAVAVVGCFVAATLAKEQGLLLPLMLLLWAGMLRWCGPARAGIDAPPATWAAEAGSRHESGGCSAGRSPLAVSPWLTALLLITLAAYILYRDHILKWTWETSILDPVLNPVAFSTGRDRWLLPVAILGRYAALLLVPWRLSPDYSADVFTTHQPLSDPYLYIGFVAALVAIAGTAIALRRRSGVAALCLLWAGLAYGLVGNWMIIGTVFGERLMYLPSLFLCVLAGIGLARLRFRWRSAVLVALLTLGSIRTLTYARHWTDTTHFYEYALREQPESSMLYMLMIDRYLQLGDDDRADRTLAAALSHCPDCWNIWDMAAHVALRHDRLDDAERMALQAFKLRPGVMSAVEVLNEVSMRREAKEPR